MSNSIRNAHTEVAERLILSYKGEEPFSNYLKKYFSENKKHGSRDRKQIAALCYGYFRLGNGANKALNEKEKTALGFFLTQENNEGENELKEKLKSVQDKFDAANIFPFNKHLSREIDIHSFNLSFLKQPYLFIRIRPGYEQSVVNKLTQSDVPFERIDRNSIRIDNSTRLQNILSIDEEVVIQDYNSQKAAELFLKVSWEIVKPLSIWDCCAGSGGKSLSITDLHGEIELTVSDKRNSILHNLKKRFARAGIKNFHAVMLDLSLPINHIAGSPFDLIIADVPCSGSGTWARTPELLVSFDEEQIQWYASLQRTIAQNVIKHLKPGGFLQYMTCSVFKEENEENVEKIIEETGMKLTSHQYFRGYEMQADTLFGAMMRRE